MGVADPDFHVDAFSYQDPSVLIIKFYFVLE
jgi:hypothetical protein